MKTQIINLRFKELYHLKCALEHRSIISKAEKQIVEKYRSLYTSYKRYIPDINSNKKYQIIIESYDEFDFLYSSLCLYTDDICSYNNTKVSNKMYKNGIFNFCSCQTQSSVCFHKFNEYCHTIIGYYLKQRFSKLDKKFSKN